MFVGSNLLNLEAHYEKSTCSK